jgi:enoyl-CoA hydratase/carnithine racemase
LGRLLGKARAIELMVTGKLLSFEEAQELGLVTEVFDNKNFMEEVMSYARKFTPPNKAAKAVGRIKRSVASGCDLPLESGLAIERELQQQLFQSDDAKEGLTAYVEKRTPKFKGV